MSTRGIEERSPGVWRIRVSAGFDPVTGKRRVIRRTVRGTEDDARTERARILAARGNGDLGTNATLGALLDAWLPKARIEASTRANYASALRTHVQPRIGNRPLSQIDVFVIDQLYEDLEEAGVTPIRIRTVHTALRAAFRKAVKWRWVTTNPCVEAEPPPVFLKEATAPTPAQVRALFAAAETLGIQWLAMLELTASLGARRGEICGLQWDDINLDVGTVQVRRAVLVLNGQGIVKHVKDNTRREPAPIHSNVVKVLRRWRLACPPTDDGWAFPDSDGAFFRPDQLSYRFRKLCTQVGISRDVKLHGLRHFVGTYLRDEGTDLDVISRRLGHSRTSTTSDVYGHAVDGRARQAADAIASSAATPPLPSYP